MAIWTIKNCSKFNKDGPTEGYDDFISVQLKIGLFSNDDQ